MTVSFSLKRKRDVCMDMDMDSPLEDTAIAVLGTYNSHKPASSTHFSCDSKVRHTKGNHSYSRAHQQLSAAVYVEEPHTPHIENSSKSITTKESTVESTTGEQPANPQLRKASLSIATFTMGNTTRNSNVIRAITTPYPTSVPENSPSSSNMCSSSSAIAANVPLDYASPANSSGVNICTVNPSSSFPPHGLCIPQRRGNATPIPTEEQALTAMAASHARLTFNTQLSPTCHETNGNTGVDDFHIRPSARSMITTNMKLMMVQQQQQQQQSQQQQSHLQMYNISNHNNSSDSLSSNGSNSKTPPLTLTTPEFAQTSLSLGSSPVRNHNGLAPVSRSKSEQRSSTTVNFFDRGQHSQMRTSNPSNSCGGVSNVGSTSVCSASTSFSSETTSCSMGSSLVSSELSMANTSPRPASIHNWIVNGGAHGSVVSQVNEEFLAMTEEDDDDMTNTGMMMDQIEGPMNHEVASNKCESCPRSSSCLCSSCSRQFCGFCTVKALVNQNQFTICGGNQNQNQNQHIDICMECRDNTHSNSDRANKILFCS